MTEGNKEKRYIGLTDEPLCSEGRRKIQEYVFEKRYPKADAIYVSPLKRCIETARLIYPDKDYILCSNLKECDFGDFENKNYLELAENEDYIKWIKSGGKQKFPSGEEPESFKKRCQEAFKEIVEGIGKDSVNKAGNKTIALVVHGGTIMAVLEKYGLPEKGFYDWQLGNGEGYECELIEYIKFDKQMNENPEKTLNIKVMRKLGGKGACI
jgi:alpha-ribazole phosphatase